MSPLRDEMLTPRGELFNQDKDCQNNNNLAIQLELDDKTQIIKTQYTKSETKYDCNAENDTNTLENITDICGG